MKKRLLIDASNVKSTGGIIHLNSILKTYKENKLMGMVQLKIPQLQIFLRNH